MVKQFHLNDEITTAKKNQEQTNERLDEVVRQLQDTNRLLTLLLERLSTR